MKTVVSLMSLAAITAVSAGDEVGFSKKSVPEADSKSRWSISGGMRTRTFRSDFNMGAIAPTGFSLTSPANFISGNGDVGFFTGGATALNYEDGSVGPAYGTQLGDFGPDGSAYGAINSESQIVPTGRYDSVGDEIFDLNFHSTRISNQTSSGYSPGGFNEVELHCNSKTRLGTHLQQAANLYFEQMPSTKEFVRTNPL